MYRICNDYGKQDHSDSQYVHSQPTFLEGVKETGADLKPDRKDKKYKPEIFCKLQYHGIGTETEMTQENANKQYPRRAYAYALDFEFAKEKPGCNDECEQ